MSATADAERSTAPEWLQQQPTAHDLRSRAASGPRCDVCGQLLGLWCDGEHRRQVTAARHAELVAAARAALDTAHAAQQADAASRMALATQQRSTERHRLKRRRIGLRPPGGSGSDVF